MTPRVLPIPFTPPMVSALLRGDKTQTRRIARKQPEGEVDSVWDAGMGPRHDWWDYWRAGDRKVTRFRTRYGVGDLLYVREPWFVGKRYDKAPPRDLPERRVTIMFDAGGSIANQKEGTWSEEPSYPPGRPDWGGKPRPGMFLPRWASRLTLEVTEVRVQRLSAISEADALAEGVTTFVETQEVARGAPSWAGVSAEDRAGITRLTFGSLSKAYACLWDTINGAGASEADPFVEAYTFRVLRQPVDDVLKERSA